MESAVIVAVVAGIVTAIGWIVNHQLTNHREQRALRHAAALHYVERQLEELYGPLVFLLHEGRQSFNDLVLSLGRNNVFDSDDSISAEDLEIWLFWAEQSFLPLNQSIKELLMGKTHLIAGSTFPPSYVAFLNHHNSWLIHHERWKQKGIEYSWHSKVDWPNEFERDVYSTFQLLKQKHSKLIGELEAE